jgi:hypothetical protein
MFAFAHCDGLDALKKEENEIKEMSVTIAVESV